MLVELSMKRIFILSAWGLTLFFIAVSFSLVWAVVLVVAAVTVGISKWKVLSPDKRKTVAAFLGLLIIVGIWVMGRAPSHLDPGSAASSRLPGINQLLGSIPADHLAANQDPPFDELTQTQAAFQKDVFKLRADANSVDQILELREATDSVVRQMEGPKLDVSRLLDAKKAVEEAMQKYELGTSEEIDAKQAALEKFLKAAEDGMKGANTATEAKRMLKQFRLGTIAKGLEVVSDRKIVFENVLSDYYRQIVDKHMTLVVRQTAQLNEESNEIEREQVVSLSMGGLAVNQIDASELLIDHDPEEIRCGLLVAYGDNVSGARPADNPKTISVHPGIKTITLIRTSVIPAGLKDLPTGLRVWPFRYFLVKWLPLAPVKLRARLDLSSSGGPTNVPYVFEVPSNAPIEAIRLPANAFYAASYPFKAPRREGSEDALEPDGELKPSDFATRSYIWIELMPNSLVFRNSLVQSKKEYFFPENAAAASTVAVVGALWALAI
jgi:hypothetical protein